MNLGFIEYLHKSINHIDVTLVDDIAKGMDIVGDIPETGALRGKTTIPQIGMNEVQEKVKVTNDKIIKDMKNTKITETAIKGWQLTCDEAKYGWLEPLGIASKKC